MTATKRERPRIKRNPWRHARTACLCFILLQGAALRLPPQAVAQILPADANAPGGGNPLEGLGRSDDTSPARVPANATILPPDSSTGSEIPPVIPPVSGETAPPAATEQSTPAPEEAQPLLPSEDTQRVRTGASAINTPLKKAIAQMNLRNYEGSLATLNQILERNSKDSQAHYLKAVVFVVTRQFSQARSEYLQSIKYSSNSELTRRAEEGLKKLNH